MRSKLTFIFLATILLSSCAAPTEIPIPSPAITATQLPTASPIETPTASRTPTPEPTATETPETIPSKPTEVTFNLTNGETLSMPAFILNNPSEDPAILEQQQIKTLEVALEYMVNVRSVAWGDDGKGRTEDLSREDYDFLVSLGKLDYPLEFVATGFRLPQDKNISDEDAFLTNIIKCGDFYIFSFRNNKVDKTKRYVAIAVKIMSPTISNLLKKAKVPEKP